MRSLVPMFASPGADSPDPETTRPDPSTPGEPLGVPVSPRRPLEPQGTTSEPPSLDEPPEPPGPARRGIRTATSSEAGGDRPRLKPEVAGRVAGTLLGAVALLAGYLVALRRGVRLRQPSQGELDSIGAPLGRIAARHMPAAVVNEDLLDGADAADAFRRYVTAAPLLEHELEQDVDPDPSQF